MEMKGVIFTFDAMLALAIVIVLFSGIVIFNLAEPTTGANQSLRYTNATDLAINEYLIGGETKDVSTSDPNTNCKEFFEFSSDVVLEVIKCS